MSKYLPDFRNISNEPLAVLGVLAAIAFYVGDFVGYVEAEGANTWGGVAFLAVTFVARLFVDGPNTNS